MSGKYLVRKTEFKRSNLSWHLKADAVQLAEDT